MDMNWNDYGDLTDLSRWEKAKRVCKWINDYHQDAMIAFSVLFYLLAPIILGKILIGLFG